MLSAGFPNGTPTRIRNYTQNQMTPKKFRQTRALTLLSWSLQKQGQGSYARQCRSVLLPYQQHSLGCAYLFFLYYILKGRFKKISTLFCDFGTLCFSHHAQRTPWAENPCRSCSQDTLIVNIRCLLQAAWMGFKGSLVTQILLASRLWHFQPITVGASRNFT